MLLTVIMAFAGAQTAGADTGNPGDGVDYVDADGVVKNTATDGIDGNDSPTVITEGSSSSYNIVTLSPGWYVVTGSNVEFKGSLQCSGAMHLILADGAKMTINCTKSGTSGMEIYNGGLTIYGQSFGTGELYVPSSTRNGIYVNGGDIIINGGKVSATTTYANAIGIYTSEHAIINDGTVTAVGTQYGIYGSNAVTINGGKVSATHTDSSSNCYGIYTDRNKTITLGFRHEDDQIYVDEYRPNNVIVKVKDGQTLRDNDNAGNRYSGTISDVSAINGKTLTPVRTVAYIDGDGVTQQTEDFTVLTGSSANTTLPAGWYVVSGSDVNYSDVLQSESGDLHIILADGARLTVGKSLLSSGNLTIYGQSGGTGQLVATAPAGQTPIQTTGGLTINGGHISASTTYNQYAILAGANGVTINGGIVSATATYSNRYGIATEGAITLGWRTASDRITASSYYAMGGVSVKAGQAFMNSDAAPAYLSGTISDMALIDGKTLRPINPADFELTATNEYTIKTADGWGQFCDLLSDYAKGIFTGKTVKLAADITVSRMAGSSDKPFTGTFNGQGKTLTVSYSGSSYVAPFSYVDGATIQNLVVEGTISSSGTRAAGVIGETGSPGTTGKSYITNCVSSSTITGGNYSGGFSIGGNVEIEGCVFNGIINSDGNSGGFVGYSQSALTITNSLFAPQSGSSAKGTFYYNGTAGTLTNCYYTQTLGTAQGTAAYVYTPATAGFVPQNVGAAGTAYDVSGITAYASGLKRGGRFYLVKASVSLADNATNNVTGVSGYVADVTLSGRTLWKDGAWNTLCLPFSLSAAQIAANANFAGATLMTMDVTEKNGFDVEDGTLYLWFKTATEIEAGVPYLVKWDKAADYDNNPSVYDIVSPVFEGVTISNSTAQTVESKTAGLETVQMVGTYSPVGVTADDKSILFLGDANTLYYSTVDRQIRSCRAYFSVPYINGHAEAKARAFALSFDGEETTGILGVSANYNGVTDEAWYSLDGVRLSGKPTQRGLYINNGKKVVIK